MTPTNEMALMRLRTDMTLEEVKMWYRDKYEYYYGRKIGI